LLLPVEAEAELQEWFLWKSDREIERDLKVAAKREAVRDCLMNETPPAPATKCLPVYFSPEVPPEACSDEFLGRVPSRRTRSCQGQRGVGVREHSGARAGLV
jgi:hypothetical protein